MHLKQLFFYYLFYFTFLFCFLYFVFDIYIMWFLRSNKTWLSERFSLLSRHKLLLPEHFSFCFNVFILDDYQFWFLLSSLLLWLFSLLLLLLFLSLLLLWLFLHFKRLYPVSTFYFFNLDGLCCWFISKKKRRVIKYL